MYEIRPLHLGTLTVDKSGLTLRKGLGQKIPAPCLGFLVLGGDEPILVDTGPSMDEDWGTRYHNPLNRPADQSLAAQLALHGLAPEQIEHVILTHLHWDHCYGNDDLPNARFYLQKTEVDYAANPLPCDAPIYETDLDPVHFHTSRDRFVTFEGRKKLRDGIDLVPLPGHSPGLQGVLVETAAGKYLIGGDHFPLFENYERNIPTGIVHSLPDWYRATEEARRFEAIVLPGHDIRVLDQVRYG